MVAAIQLAIAMGAAAGGGILDVSGVSGVFAAGSAILLLATLIILTGVRSRTAAVVA
jgi:predicted MFS family arabinose efflux permease